MRQDLGKYLLLALTMLGFGRQVLAASYDDIKKAEKISYALTGKPLPDEMRLDFINGKISLEQIADEITTSQGFIDYLSQFWTKLLGIQNGIDPYAIRLVAKGKTVRENTPTPEGDQQGVGTAAGNWQNRTAEQIDGHIRVNNEAAAYHIHVTDCEKDGKHYGLFFMYRYQSNMDNVRLGAERGYIVSEDNRNLPIAPGSQEAWKRLYAWMKSGDSDCNNPDNRVVRPWWDPGTPSGDILWATGLPYKAAPLVYERCGGETLQKCELHAHKIFEPFSSQVGGDLAMEAGNLIANTVAQDKPFSEVLTTTDTFMTGRFGAFMGTLGKDFWGNFPGGTIEDIRHPIFTNINVLDSKQYRIKRGKGHAGVLTTPIYQFVTNGRRAKANRAYGAFLCSKFAVPDGINPDPSDSNPDLTKRHYCDSCHRSLEPMAAYFNSWPTTGVTEYIYTEGQDDRGSFNGESGKGAEGFAAAIVKSPKFEDCAVKRAFEFVNGRKMTTVENENQTPQYLAKLKAHHQSLRAVIRMLVLSPEFLEPQERK